MKLFDDKERTNHELPTRTDSAFDYLNNTARPDAAKLRALIESWFQRYLETKKSDPSKNGKFDLQQRFQSDSDDVHHSAYFEVLLHEILIKTGVKVEVHPAPQTGFTTKPDFLVTKDEYTQFIVEAVTCSGKTQDEKAADARANSVYQIVDKLNHPNFDVGIESIKGPEEQPSGNEIKKWLIDKLNQLDYDEILIAWIRGKENVPHWQWNKDGWDIVFFPLPLPNGQRNVQDCGSIVCEITPIHECTLDESLRKALKDKAYRYGKIEIPYIIAVNVTDIFADDFDFKTTLFGDLSYYTSGAVAGNIHDSNGLFGTKKHPKATHVSGVMFFKKATPWYGEKYKIYYYPNPWCEKDSSFITVENNKLLI